MNNARRIQIVVAVGVILFGASFFYIKTDSEFAKLTPTEESKYLVPMKTGASYDQDIVIHNKILSKIGIYFLPLHPLEHHTGIVTMSLLRGSAVLESAHIDSSYIDPTVPTEFALTHPIASAQDETLRIRVAVSDSISTDIALRNRTFDNDFSGEDVHFSIDGVAQQYPFAYTADERLHPALIKQVGGMIVISGLVLLFLPLLLTIAGLQGLSAIGSQTSIIFYASIVLIVLVVSWSLLRVVGRSKLAALFGACVIACSTWLPLMLIPMHGNADILSFKNALLDPNQIKVSHAGGAYVGFFALFFAAIGILAVVYGLTRDTRKRVFVDALVIVLLVVLLALHLWVPVAWGIAYLASLGLDRAKYFMGHRDKFITVLFVLLICIALLDLMHVASVTLAYGATI
jgi:hypothetical protein